MYSEIYQNSIIDDSVVLDKEDLKKRLIGRKYDWSSDGVTILGDFIFRDCFESSDKVCLSDGFMAGLGSVEGSWKVIDTANIEMTFSDVTYKMRFDVDATQNTKNAKVLDDNYGMLNPFSGMPIVYYE